MSRKAPADDSSFLDTIKRLAITGLFSDDKLLERLVLKGGNLLDLVYQISPRASADVDISMDGEFEGTLDELRRRIDNGLSSTFSDAGYVVFDLTVQDVPPNVSDDIKSFWGGYKIAFKIIEAARFNELKSDLEQLRRNSVAVGKRGSTKFAIDISKHEYCDAKERADLNGYTIFIYPPAMFICEKLRAICQQMPDYVKVVRSHPSARARDFVDIYVVRERYGINFADAGFRELIRRTFDIKKVPIRLIGELSQVRDFHSQDFVALQDTVKGGRQLNEFNFYFDYLIRCCDELNAFWNE